MPEVPLAMSLAPSWVRMFPETDMEPPAKTCPVRRPSESGNNRVFPDTSSMLLAPMRTVVKRGGSEGDGKLLAPVMEMEPPGVFTEPRTVVVCPVMVTVPLASVSM